MLSRIQQYLRVVAPIGREHLQIGPFLATFTDHTDNPYLSYALPDDLAEPSADEVDELIDAYVRRRRQPRLEYIAACAPAVEQRLLERGFTVEGRLPVLVTDVDALLPGANPEGIELCTPSTDDELYDMAVVQAKAYGQPELLDHDVVARRRAGQADGDLAIIAVSRSSGAVVGAGICARIADGLTEVAAIAVAQPYRRRGIGAALAGRLAREALEAGADMPWLMAEGERSRRIYERVGYRVIGEILHISR